MPLASGLSLGRWDKMAHHVTDSPETTAPSTSRAFDLGRRSANRRKLPLRVAASKRRPITHKSGGFADLPVISGKASDDRFARIPTARAMQRAVIAAATGLT